MDKALINFFKTIDFVDSDKHFIESKVKIKYYHHNQRGTVEIEIPNFLPIKVLKEFDKKLKDINLPISFDLKVTENNYDFTLVKSYFEYIKLFKLHLFAGIFSTLPTESLNLNKEDLIILVQNETEIRLVEKEASNFLNYFYQYGFKNLKIKVNCNTILPAIPSIQNEIANELKHVTAPNNLVPKKTTWQRRETNNIDLGTAIDTHKIKEIISRDSESGAISNIVLTVTIFKITKFLTKQGKWFYTYSLTDNECAILAKVFVSSKKQEEMVSKLKEKDTIKVSANSKYDDFAKEHVIWIQDFIPVEKLIKDRSDTSKEKRIEFHVHTKMSAMDGVTDAEDYIATAAQWGHKAIAFTDHLNVQAYPDIAQAAKKFPQVKVIYGVEMNLIPDVEVVMNSQDKHLEDLEYLVFDLETTGFSTKYHEIIEFGYSIVKNNQIIKQDTILIKPNKLIKPHITEITNITNEMLNDKPSLIDVIQEIKNIIGNRTLVAHNASFDIGFLKAAFKNLGIGELDNQVIDTLHLSRIMNPELKYFRLGIVCRAYDVEYDGDTAHRADYDAAVLAKVFLKMLNRLQEENELTNSQQLNDLMTEKLYFKLRGEHITVYAKNQEGLKSVYNLISDSHTKYFYNEPKVIKSAFDSHRNNILIGSSCVNGAIFETAMNKDEESLVKKMEWFDFIEVQPPAVYRHLVLKQNLTELEIEDVIKTIINCAKKLNKIVIATSDAHYLNPQDKVFRSIIISNKGIGGIPHPLFDYKNPTQEKPNQHLRTTDEMCQEFSFLNDEALINEIVIKNTNYLQEQFTPVKPIKDGLFTPTIANVDEKLRTYCFEQAWKIYGKKLPEVVESRLNRELNSIISNGFAVVYWIAHKLVEKSLSDGYLVGSRGSVGSSLVATFANITEVNPLQPHYLCLQCHYVEFISNGKVKCGYDLEDKLCPNCNKSLKTEGHDIPFETFLGFDGDKVPDIDLNFSGEYQIQAHDFTKTMFGENNVFRAGTISTVASKTAYGFTKNYAEQHQLTLGNSTIDWLSSGCVGVKRTTGQHPGGIIVVPNEYEINDFSPINYPADDVKSSWKTTHFAFEAIHDNLLKLDILGHVDPTALKMLHELTGVDPKTIPNQDEKVLSLFSNLDALNINKKDINDESTGAMGIPEFGTSFVRKMLSATNPKSFAELVQISGLSHGTDVWTNNAEKLINEDGLKLKDVIGCRDDIMTYLVYQGLPAIKSFAIMEDVRKGKGLKPEYEKLMLENNVPKWYINSCKKIKYMFPKAHATAYVLMAWRVAWYKVYYPYEYYSTFFSTRCDIFDIKTMIGGKPSIEFKLKEINQKMKVKYDKSLTTKEKDLVPMLEVALEMYARGIEFTNIDLLHSEVKNFKIHKVNGKKKILLPFTTLDGLGEIVAQSIVEARKTSEIISKEDLQSRTGITKTNYKLFDELGILEVFKLEEITT